jgi:hypothetical protein
MKRGVAAALHVLVFFGKSFKARGEADVLVEITVGGVRHLPGDRNASQHGDCDERRNNIIVVGIAAALMVFCTEIDVCVIGDK